jgi:class 3 adenylate cyclase
VAFHRPEHAVNWCMAVQLALYQTTWSQAITTATVHAKCDKFNGLRVRMGMHSGVVDQVRLCCESVRCLAS